MKKMMCAVFLFMLCGCVFTYDPPGGLLHIRNNSEEAIYVYLKCGKADLLPLAPKLELFIFFNNENESARDASGNPLKSGLVSPEYRINAYNTGFLHIRGSKKRPCLPCEEKEVTLFFITEKTMRNYDWEDISKDQIFIKKVTITERELDNSNWVYTYYGNVPD